jgi:hypothetical protein
MTSVPHDPPAVKTGWSRLVVREMWASLAITSMWVAVVLGALFGPDIVAQSSPVNSTTIPSAVAIAMFATIGTWFVAKYGLRGDDRDSS